MNLSEFLKAKHDDMQSISMYEEMKFGLECKTENGDLYLMLEILIFGNSQSNATVAYSRIRIGKSLLLSAEMCYIEAKTNFATKVNEILNNVDDDLLMK